MKIIAGEKKGYPLQAPEGQETRPTLARVRENLFNILAPYIPEAVVWDLFAGSGSLGLEALSRGAKKAVFVENRRDALNSLRANISKLQYEATADVRAQFVKDFLISNPPAPDIIIADPPYAKEVMDEFFAQLQETSLPPDTLIIVQTDGKYTAPLTENSPLILTREKKYGKTKLQFFDIKI